MLGGTRFWPAIAASRHGGLISKKLAGHIEEK
jgi:hypothetical protein